MSVGFLFKKNQSVHEHLGDIYMYIGFGLYWAVRFCCLCKLRCCFLWWCSPIVGLECMRTMSGHVGCIHFCFSCTYQCMAFLARIVVRRCYDVSCGCQWCCYHISFLYFLRRRKLMLKKETWHVRNWNSLFCSTVRCHRAFPSLPRVVLYTTNYKNWSWRICCNMIGAKTSVRLCKLSMTLKTVFQSGRTVWMTTNGKRTTWPSVGTESGRRKSPYRLVCWKRIRICL